MFCKRNKYLKKLRELLWHQFKRFEFITFNIVNTLNTFVFILYIQKNNFLGA